MVTWGDPHPGRWFTDIPVTFVALISERERGHPTEMKDAVAKVLLSGCQVVSVASCDYRSNGDRVTLGAETARMALLDFGAAGIAEDRPIYFKVPVMLGPDGVAGMDLFFRGAKSILGEKRVGIYSSPDHLRYAWGYEMATWFFQAIPVGQPQEFQEPHIRHRCGPNIAAPSQCAWIQSDRQDFGQWPLVEEITSGKGNANVAKEGEGSVVAGGVEDQAAAGGPAEPPAMTPVEIKAELEGILEEMGWVKADGPIAALVDTLSLIHGRLQGIEDMIKAQRDAPLVDPVAVATAIAASPEIARKLAEDVAQQLGTIVGSLSLSGSLNAGIRPPQ